ncbi:MAG: hypothetical protein HON23_02755 [Rickettsiales bacterium]|jgi:hypothetical protein|nr:hypothetical protein [Rickettsiales bacterium]
MGRSKAAHALCYAENFPLGQIPIPTHKDGIWHNNHKSQYSTSPTPISAVTALYYIIVCNCALLLVKIARSYEFDARQKGAIYRLHPNIMRKPFIT